MTRSSRTHVIFALLAFMLVYGGSIIWLTFMLLLWAGRHHRIQPAIVASVNNTGPEVGTGGPPQLRCSPEFRPG